MTADATQALAAAEDALTRWEQVVAQKARDAEVAAAGLAEHEARMGADVLDDPDALTRATDELLRLRAEQEVAHRAAETARERVGDARRAKLSAQVASLTARAGTLREVAPARQARTDQLVAALREHERVAYDVTLTHSDTGTGWRPRTFTALILEQASALDKLAAELAKVAEAGTAEQVVAALGRPVREPSQVELDALAEASQPAAV